MSISQTIELAEDFIKLAEKYREEFRDIKQSQQTYRTFQMKSRAIMKRKSMELSEALVELRKHTAFSDEA